MDGILVVDKPQGMTSHDVVDFVRKKFGVKKAGHAGTLDPMATGVLVLLIGAYTKRSNALMGHEKEYEATMVLGATSDTGDAWGTIEPSRGKRDVAEAEIMEVFKKFEGMQQQTPPAYSAVKVNGRKLYELARQGIKVTAAPRAVEIKKLVCARVAGPEVDFTVLCSKGTYVRALAEDIGASLGCGAYLSKLKRTRSGPYSIAQALAIEELRAMDRPGFERHLFS